MFAASNSICAKQKFISNLHVRIRHQNLITQFKVSSRIIKSLTYFDRSKRRSRDNPESKVYVIQFAREPQGDFQGRSVIVPLGRGRIRIHRMRCRQVQPISSRIVTQFYVGQIDLRPLVKLSKKVEARARLSKSRQIGLRRDIREFRSLSITRLTTINLPSHLELRTSIASDSTESSTFSRISWGNFTSTVSHSQDAVLGVLKLI